MMHDPDTTYLIIKDNARRLAEGSAQRREAAAATSGHSRTGLMAQFLRQLADRIDPSGEDRRTL
jgi:hypothetical protein